MSDGTMFNGPAVAAPANAANELNEAVQIDLVKPLIIRGVQVSVLHMRRPVLINQIAMRKQSAVNKWTGEEEDIFMYASLCGVTPADLMHLDMADYLELCRVYGNFLQRPPKNSPEQPSSSPGTTDGLPMSSIG